MSAPARASAYCKRLFAAPRGHTSGSAGALTSCDSTSTPVADRSLSKRLVSWNPKARVKVQ